MKEKINEILSENPNISLSDIAKSLKIKNIVKILRDTPSPKVRSYPIDKIEELFDIFREWEKVFFLVVTPSFVLEIKDKFPKGFKAHGFLNFHDQNSSIGGHLSIDEIKEIFFVDDFMFGRRSCSIRFFDRDEKEIFAIYVPRNENKELIQEYLDSFLSII